MDAPGPGGLGGTFAGNPVACEAALAVLDMFEQQDLNARASELGDAFQKRAREWHKRWPMIGEVRGLGAMQAIELVQSQDKREPAPEETKQVTQYCYEHGVITISAGTYGNVIRLLMPLVITDAQMDEALDVLESALKTVYEKKHEAAAQPV
jgi:4-aminobutyrate aminotransferase/(S)-3-amino-2-methylpropionate transaminase